MRGLSEVSRDKPEDNRFSCSKRRITLVEETDQGPVEELKEFLKKRKENRVVVYEMGAGLINKDEEIAIYLENFQSNFQKSMKMIQKNWKKQKKMTTKHANLHCEK